MVVLASPGLAQNIIFFDEFDSYGGAGDLSILSDPVWTIDACWDARVATDDVSPYTYYSPLYSAEQDKDPNTGKLIGVRNKHVFTPAEIQSIPGAEVNANCISGSDGNYLRVVYLLHSKIQSFDYARANRFVEIVCGNDRAPTAMIHKVCGVPPDEKNRYHLANVSNDPNASGADVHASIAIGMVAMADPNPCSPEAKQEVYRLVVYDGQYWRILHDYPTIGTNLHMCYKWNWIEMRIKTSTIDVILKNKYVDNPEGDDCLGGNFGTTMTTTIDRKYMGDFTAVVMGGLIMEDAEDPPDPYRPVGNCWGERRNGGIDNAANHIDNLYVQGGVGRYSEYLCIQVPPPPGACCVKYGYGKGACSRTTQSNCNIPGSTYLGDGTNCGFDNENCEFCNTDLVFDTDYDGDVDQDDFSLFQVCFGATSPLEPLGCKCFDEHAKVGGGDDNITLEDYVAFEGCASGPNVPANPSCD
jgi:hypothetical protein